MPAQCVRIVAFVFAVVSCIPLGSAQQTTDEFARIDRLADLAQLWAAVKYFHPYLAYRDDIDWDEALLKAIPKVNAAANRAEYADAAEGMLKALNDPATHIFPDVLAREIDRAAGRQPGLRRKRAVFWLLR